MDLNNIMTGNFVDVVPLGQGGGITSAFKSFFNQVSTWDFSLLKWVLIALPIIGIILLIYWFIIGKIRLYDDGTFGQGYGLRLITGAFGTGKTKNVFQSAYIRKKDNPDGILISNLDYDFVDVYFNSKKDFDFIMKDIVQYIYDTNKSEDLKKSIDFPPIKIIVDEAHLYLFAREFKSFTKDLLLVLTQCRKRDISIDFITQELGQIDVFIRRLCPYIEYFESSYCGTTKQSIFYCLDSDTTSMRNEESFEEVESTYLLPFSRVPYFKPSIKGYYEQKYLTKKVIGNGDFYSSTESEEEKISYRYKEFKEFMDKKIEVWRTPLPPRKTIFDSLFKKDDDLQQKIIEEQKKKIDELIKLIPDDVLKDFSINNDSEINVNNLVENSVEMPVENSPVSFSPTENNTHT